MKKTARILVVVMMIAILATSLVSCSKILNGKYTAEVDWLGVAKTTVTYEFSGKEVTKTAVTGIGSLSNTTTDKGTYEIKEDPEDSDKLVIVFTFGEEGNTTSTTYSFSEGTLDGEKIIIINGSQFTKTK